MELINTKKLEILESSVISIGNSRDMKVIGICLFDKYCWTNVFGFEIL